MKIKHLIITTVLILIIVLNGVTVHAQSAGDFIPVAMSINGFKNLLSKGKFSNVLVWLYSKDKRLPPFTSTGFSDCQYGVYACTAGDTYVDGAAGGYSIRNAPNNKWLLNFDNTLYDSFDAALSAANNYIILPRFAIVGSLTPVQALGVHGCIVYVKQKIKIRSVFPIIRIKIRWNAQTSGSNCKIPYDIILPYCTVYPWNYGCPGYSDYNSDS